jgi:hypothetical protein
MPDDIEKIRAELNTIREDAELFFADVGEIEAANADRWDGLSYEDKERAYGLRRRNNMIARDLQQVIENQHSFLITDSMLSEFRWHTAQASAAFQFRRYTEGLPIVDDPNNPGVPYKAINLEEARCAFLEGHQQARALLRSIAGSSHDFSEPIASPTIMKPPLEPTESTGPECKDIRRKLVDDFIRNVAKQTGKTIIRKDIWRVAGHKQSRQFELWQSCSDRATKSDNRNFRRILEIEGPA